MYIYLDESYDNAHAYYILGALWVPRPEGLNAALSKVKREEGYEFASGETKEIKYTQIYSSKLLRIAKEAVQLFMRSDAWFRCIVVDQRPESGWSYDYFGRFGESQAIKEARFYKRFAQMLVENNSEGIENAILLLDRMTRCAGDELVSRLEEVLSMPRGEPVTAPIVSQVQEVDTALEPYQLGQVCDLLMGAVLNDLIRPTGGRSRYKRAFTYDIKETFGVPSLGSDYWRMPRYRVNSLHPKFQVWHWEPNFRK